MEYTKIAETPLPLRVLPEKRTLYGDIIARVYGDRLLTGEETTKILGEKKLMEEYPLHSKVSELYRIISPDEFPSRIGVYRDNKLHVSTVPYGTKVEDVNKELDIPDGHRVFWFTTTLRGKTLQNMFPDRMHPLRSSAIFPNAMNNHVSVAYIVEESEQYIFIQSPRNYGSGTARYCPGPPIIVLPFEPIEDISQKVRQIMSVYTQDDVRRNTFRVYETFIPMDGSASLAEFTTRYTLRPDHDMNTIVFDQGAQSDLIPCIEQRARYIQTWQRLEHSPLSMQLSSIRSRSNKTKYALSLDDEGRVTVSYWIETKDNMISRVNIVSAREFEQFITNQSTIYDTETHLAERLGFFSTSGSMFDTVSNSVPSHISDMQTDSRYRDAVWYDESMYSYQKETVEAMIHHERYPDGLFGLYLSRLSGRPGEPGIFMDWYRNTNYVDKGFDYIAGILCDDTGMGKTRQITNLIKHTRNDVETATLIVVPPSIMHQWRSEMQQVWPDIRILVLYGRERNGVSLPDDALTSDVAITTYTTLTKYSDFFTSVHWSRIVMDEAHTIPRSFLNMDLATHRLWCVTATPEIQWQRILTMIVTGFDRQMPSVYSITAKFDHSYQESLNEAIWRCIRPITFRKTRDRYLELPTVYTSDAYHDLSPQEREVYTETMAALQSRRYMTNSVQAMNAIRTLQTVASTGQIPPASMNITVRDSWFHPESKAPFDDIPEDDCAICMSPLEVPSRTLCHHWFCRECIGNAMIRNPSCPLCRSRIDPGTIFLAESPQQNEEQRVTQQEPSECYATKMVAMASDISAVLRADPSDRILVFFDTQTVLNTFSKVLDRMKISWTSIHGGVSVTTRSRRISKFQYDNNSPHRVMLLTIKTACAGITLTRANHIFLAGPVIPKDLETQMIGRSHRLGQQKPVYFKRYIARNTIEESLSTSNIHTNQAVEFISRYLFH